jgi:hypothetical protein
MEEAQVKAFLAQKQIQVAELVRKADILTDKEGGLPLVP